MRISTSTPAPTTVAVSAARGWLPIFLAALRGDAAYVTRELGRDRSLANFGDTCHHRVLSAAVRLLE